MKYEIIGWTFCGTQSYPVHKYATACVTEAIIKEIRRYGYLFGGDTHEDYCPVLNDGTYVSFSWRGWGGIMARAYGIEGDYSYMFAYMNQLLDPDKIKTPEWGEVCDAAIVDRETIAETFEMHLSPDMFDAVKAGTKTVEIRLFDDKRKLIDYDDYIEFIKVGDETQRVKRRVTGIDIYDDLEELFLTNEIQFKIDSPKVLRFQPEEVGSPAGSSAKDMAKAMGKYYTAEQIEKYGLIAFRLQKPEHKCKTCFTVGFDIGDGQDICEQKWEKGEDDDKCFDGMLISELYAELTEDLQRYGFRLDIGTNEKYDPDVNAMLRETLKDLFGKEDKLKELRYRLCVSYTLKIFTVNYSKAEEKQNLEIADDIKEFLEKADAELEIVTTDIG